MPTLPTSARLTRLRPADMYDLEAQWMNEISDTNIFGFEVEEPYSKSLTPTAFP